jgi:hypothetical protein
VVADFHQLNMLIQLLQKWYIFIQNLWNNYVHPNKSVIISIDICIIKGSLGGETSVLRTFRMSGKELVKERVSEGKS